MNQTSFVPSESSLHQPRSVMNQTKDIDASTWLWALSIALILSAAINIFNLGRHYERKNVTKKP